MTTYCPAGHLVRYADVKPAKCPTCQTSLAAPSVATAIAAAIPAAPATPQRQSWADVGQAPAKGSTFPVQQDSFEDGNFKFEGDISISSDEDGAQPMTVKQLAESDTPVERRETKRSAPPGQEEVVTASSLVSQMVQDTEVRSAPAPKRSRAPRKSRAPKGAS